MARKPTAKASPPKAPLVYRKPLPPPPGEPWHHGRTFYKCPFCCAQDERKESNPPRWLDCWNCEREAAMAQYVPAPVRREREAGRV